MKEKGNASEVGQGQDLGHPGGGEKGQGHEKSKLSAKQSDKIISKTICWSFLCSLSFKLWCNFVIRERRKERDRDAEDEEEAYERRKLEKKLREKEAAYQEVDVWNTQFW